MLERETCEETIVHEETVEKIKQVMPEVAGMVEIFKALADETRLKIAYALTITDEMCVCDVAAIIEVSNATASHHLRYLKEKALATSDKKGKMVYYQLADHHVVDLVKIAYEHSIEEEE